jgi:hypothetical protein
MAWIIVHYAYFLSISLEAYHNLRIGLVYKSILTPVYPTIPYRPSWNNQNVRPISLPLPFSLLGLV